MGVAWRGIRLLLTVTVAVILSFLVMLWLLFLTLRHGPRAVFSRKARPTPPAVLQDPSLGTHGYVDLGDVRLHYVSAGSEGKPLMLLVHGFPEFWYSWRHQLREFQKDYRVVAIDLRGYGDSDKPTSVDSYSMDTLVSDIQRLVPALGYEHCVLVGHDWGALLAWEVAGRCPSLVSRLVILNNASAVAFARWILSSPRRFLIPLHFYFFQVPWLPECFWSSLDFWSLDQSFLGSTFGVKSGRMTPEDVEAYKFAFSRGGFTAPINYYRSMVREPDFLTYLSSSPSPGKYGMVTSPTLILWGDDDKALHPQLAYNSSRLSVQGGATVRLIEGASHWVQMDRPDLVNRYMREFLKSRQ